MTPQLKRPAESYPPRLTRFLNMLESVRKLHPLNTHLWKVMDSVAFDDTETALEVTLLNAAPKKKPGKKIAASSSKF